MTWELPPSTITSWRQGDKGVGVWAVQRALNTVPGWPDVALDGDYGPATVASVKEFQRITFPKDKSQWDGIAGPATQRAVATRHVRTHDQDLPAGLLSGFAFMEGGWLLAPVNWSVPGGVDCGLFQRRVYAGDYDDDAVIQRAFDAGYQAGLLADRLVELRAILQPRLGTNDRYGGMPPREKAWRLAALNHNFPAATDRLSRTPIAELDPSWTSPATWVTGFGYRFPDGTAIRTPLDWCHMYAGVLGAETHATNGSVTSGVTVWP